MHPSTTPRGKLVVAHPERKAQRALQRMVGATLCSVEVVDNLEALLERVDEDTIAIVDVGLAQMRPNLRATRARAWIAVPGEGLAPADSNVVDALLTAGWAHVVAQPMPLLAEELLATVQKLLRTDVFGLEKYVAWGAEVQSYTLENARDREAAVATITRDVIAVGLTERMGSLVSVIVDELVANALYVAPVTESGLRFRSAEPREQSRALTGRDKVTVRWATDARYLAIEVRDLWGSLEAATIAGRLAKGGNSTVAGEGGMGLPLAYACCTQFVIDCAPKELTEVIALLDVRYKPTELGRSVSFHAFVGPPPLGDAS
ncbi:MAG: hypothetical protein SFX73_15935 [Kofleriaceae bacterium]|nr:hypothetical protein [Kofleriaceae bacterium]